MTTQVKRDGSDDLHRRKTEPVANYSTPMNTVDTALKQYVVKTSLGTRIDIPAPVLEKYIESLTNEAELRGRVEPFDFVQPCEPECSPERHAYHQGQWDMATRMEAALLKLSSASSLEPERSQESKPRKEGQ